MALPGIQLIKNILLVLGHVIHSYYLKGDEAVPVDSYINLSRDFIIEAE